MSDPPAKVNVESLAMALSSLWWLPLVRGILLMILGVYALLQPGMTLAIFAQVAGFFLVFDGLLAVIAGVAGQVPSRLWTIIRGVFAVLAGSFVFAHPVLVAGLTAAFVVSVIGVLAILSGVIEIIAAIQDRKKIEGEGWLILSGILLVLIGVALLATPLLFGLTMIRVLGVLSIMSSIGMIVFAFRMKGLKSELPAHNTSTEGTR
jgi:uncharacterized membrane protein HdeD (DUF308 family)